MSLPQPTLGLTAAEHRVPVLLPYPFPGPFDYRVPPGLEPKPGDVVLVPLNRREEVGVVWDAPADTAVPALVRSPEIDRLLPDMASVHSVEAVEKLLAAGVPIDTRGEHGATALHWACWKGYADLVKLLLAHGASLDVKDEAFHADPAGWVDHGRENNGDRRGSDYPAVAEALRAAGCKVD